MIGRRIGPDENGSLPMLQPGDFWIYDGIWHGITPNDYPCNLGNHTVIEHEDNSITVSPSIRVSISNTEDVWHGYLEQGVWKEC